MYKNKKIAIGMLFMSHNSITGSFVYAKNLLDNLFQIDKTNTYYLFIRLNDYFYFKKRYSKYKKVKFVVIDIRKDLLTNPLRAVKKLFAKIQKDEVSVKNLVLDEMQNYLDKNKMDIFFSPSQIIYPEGLKRINIITMIADLQHDYLPNNFSASQLLLRKSGIKYSVENSKYIISISQYTKKTILEQYPVDPEKIFVIYLAPNITKNEKNISLPNKFILYPSALWPHKNHKILIEAFDKLKYKFPDLHLVLTGETKRENFKEKLIEFIKKFGIENKVHMLGFVSDEELSYIYRRASIMVYPSSFEGFGMPIVEAFANGVPVVAANNTSITEIVSGAGLLFETGNVSELFKCMDYILSNNNIRKNLIEKGLVRSKNFSWEENAEKTLEIFNKK